MAKHVKKVIQGHFGHGWEDMCEYTRGEDGPDYVKAARLDFAEYQRSGIGSYRLITRNDPTVYCFDCGKVCESNGMGGTGYGTDNLGRMVCYDCCAIADFQHMEEGRKMTLYLICDTGGDPVKVTNWPSTLEFPVDRWNKGKHNMAGFRFDVWFSGPDGWIWHGVSIGGNTQLCHAKKTKAVW